MCYDRYLRRRRDEAEKSDDLWKDFERTRPVAEPEPPAEFTEAERAEAHEELTQPER
jgi:hypothetical protein